MNEIVNILQVKKYLQGVHAVVFDLDDTLYGEKQYIRSGFRQIANVLPNVEFVEEKLWAFFEDGKPAIDELIVSEGLDRVTDKKKCLEVYRTHIPQIDFYEGVRDMLINMKKDGFLLGVITDGRPEGQNAKIQALGLKSLVDEIIITDELGGQQFRKPNDRAFKLMAKKLKVDYERMCYIGDNANKDFVAPHKLGMKSIWFRNADGLYAKECSKV